MDKQSDILKRYWGFSSLYPSQQKVIRSVLDGRDTLALMPTGGGKSMCYQLPAMLLNGITIVVSPLISLIENQVKSLLSKGIPARYINSTLDPTQIQQTLSDAAQGKIKLLYITPERILTVSFLKALESFDVSLVAVDEAHCISQWGHDFRPSYRNIRELSDRCKCPVLALTATATPKVREDILKNLGFDSQANVISESFERKNLSYVILRTQERLTRLLSFLREIKGSSIIYCGARSDIHYIAKVLEENGVSCAQYHAGMNSFARTAAQRDWMNGNKKVIVATSAFGMGIDKPDVRLVVHWYVPESVEDYFQQAGRAGRDGQSSRCVMLIDQTAIETMRYHSTVEANGEYVMNVYHRLCSYCSMGEGDYFEDPVSFSFDDFCVRYGLQADQARSAMSWLSRVGVINFYGTEYMRSRVKIRLKAENIYDMAQNSLTRALETVVRSTDGVFGYLCDIDSRVLAPMAGMKIEEFEAALIELAKRDVVEYYPSRKYQLLVFPNIRRTDAVRTKISSAIKDSAARKRERGKYMESLLEANTCLSEWMRRYFGEENVKACGVCSNCSSAGAIQEAVDMVDVFSGKSLSVKQIATMINKNEKETIAILRTYVEDGRVVFDGVNKFRLAE